MTLNSKGEGMRNVEKLKKALELLGIKYEEIIQEETQDQFGHTIDVFDDFGGSIYFVIENDKCIFSELN